LQRSRTVRNVVAAQVDDDFVVDLRSDDLRVYESLGSVEYDCVVELVSGGSRVALAPFLAPNARFPAGGVPQHDCGTSPGGSTIVNSKGSEAIVSTRDCGLMQLDRGGGVPDPLVGAPEAQATLDDARIYAWVGDRIAAERYARIDILSSETGAAIAEPQVLPGDIRDLAQGGSQLVILSEPFHVGDIEDPRAPPGDWLIFTLDVQALSPALRRVDNPDRWEVVEVAIDEQAVYGISLDGKVHRWTLDGGAATSSDFLPDAPKEVFASVLGLFGSTDDGWWHWDGSTARPVVIPHPGRVRDPSRDPTEDHTVGGRSSCTYLRYRTRLRRRSTLLRRSHRSMCSTRRC